MLKSFLAAVAVGVALTEAAPAVIAQEPPKLHTLSTASARAQLRDEIARMADLSPKEIEVHATNTT